MTPFLDDTAEHLLALQVQGLAMLLKLAAVKVALAVS